MADEIQKLKTDIALNQVVMVIGTRVSLYTTNGEQEVAYWKGLLKHGLHQCHQLGSLTNADLEYLTRKFDIPTTEVDDYLAAANRIKDCLKEYQRNGARCLQIMVI